MDTRNNLNLKFKFFLNSAPKLTKKVIEPNAFPRRVNEAQISASKIRGRDARGLGARRYSRSEAILKYNSLPLASLDDAFSNAQGLSTFCFLVIYF